jgi:hypothetical protein
MPSNSVRDGGCISSSSPRSNCRPEAKIDVPHFASPSGMQKISQFVKSEQNGVKIPSPRGNRRGKVMAPSSFGSRDWNEQKWSGKNGAQLRG